LTDRTAIDIANGNASGRGFSVDSNSATTSMAASYPVNATEVTIVSADSTVRRIDPSKASTPGVIILQPGETVITNSTTPSTSEAGTKKKDCIKDVVSNFFKDAKGMITGVINEAKGIVTGAINDVKTLIGGIGQAISCIDLEFNLKKISLKGIFGDIKKGIEDGINDAINFVKGIGDTLKEARSFLTCEKGTAYEQQEATIDDQLAKATDEDHMAGVGGIKKNFTSGREGWAGPMSPKRRRDIANGNASGRGFVNTQVLAAEESTLGSIKSQARSECGNNNSGKSLTGIGEALNTTNYG
jgi:hypothetical protein